MKKRKDGRFMKQVYVGKKDSEKRDVNGSPIYIKQYKTVYGKTQREVEEKAYELRVKLSEGIDYVSAEDTFGIWAKRFLDCKNSEGLSRSHLYNLENFIKYMSPIQHISIETIVTQNIRDVILDLYVEKFDFKGRLIHKAYSKRTLTGVKQCAKQIFDFAIESRAINYNPAQFVKIPKNALKTTREALTEEQQQWINEFEHRAKRAAMLMLHAGLRRGEVVALTWRDIDLEQSTITVSKAVEYAFSNQAKVKSTKTEAGVRVINIPKCLCDYLRSERGKDNCIYVLHMQDGRMMSETSWRHMWTSYMKDLDISCNAERSNRQIIGVQTEPFTPHQLRHTFATNCYLAGVDAQTCMEWMGHSNVETTLGIYTHISKKHKKQVVNKLDAYYADNQLISV